MHVEAFPAVSKIAGRLYFAVGLPVEPRRRLPEVYRWFASRKSVAKDLRQSPTSNVFPVRAESSRLMIFLVQRPTDGEVDWKSTEPGHASV